MCPDCAARRKAIRDAWVNKKIKEAVKEAAKGAAELAGLKKKTGVADRKKSRAQKTPAKPVNGPTGQDNQE